MAASESRKRKRAAQAADTLPRKASESAAAGENQPAQQSPQPSPDQAPVPSETPADPTVDETVADPSDSKQKRFIVFIGNLPFTATTESITQHFSKLRPTSIRHNTSKGTGKSKGFAFLEFEGYDRMKTCLKLYHHSSFDDGVSAARKINVELTAGGGGSKSKHRKTKLKEKNYKLTQERSRAAAATQGEKKDKGKEEGVELEVEEEPNNQEESIHPSRRNRVRTK